MSLHSKPCCCSCACTLQCDMHRHAAALCNAFPLHHMTRPSTLFLYLAILVRTPQRSPASAPSLPSGRPSTTAAAASAASSAGQQHSARQRATAAVTPASPLAPTPAGEAALSASLPSASSPSVWPACSLPCPVMYEYHTGACCRDCSWCSWLVVFLFESCCV